MNEQGAADDVSQETDEWWGAYSGLMLLPSLAVCVVLTGALVWLAWMLVEKRHVQWTFWTMAGAVWLVQTYRWSWRVFGINYRLTNRRLRVEIGHLWRRSYVIDRVNIVRVEVRRDPLGKLLNIGRIVVRTATGAPLVMEGVARPDEVAKRIREQRP